MSKMKSLAMLYGLSAMASASMREVYEPQKETEQERKERYLRAEIKSNKAKGLSKYSYGENNLWALNRVSADKKAKKRGWI